MNLSEFDNTSFGELTVVMPIGIHSTSSLVPLSKIPVI